jgi:hypothetical protein
MALKPPDTSFGALPSPLEEPRELLSRNSAMEIIGHELAQRRAENRVADERAGLAHTMLDALAEQVIEFQARLADDEEFGAALASFGQHVTITVTGIRHRNPHLIIIDGRDYEGRPVELVQHTSQISLLFVRLKVEGRAPNRIGFAA